MIDSCFDTIVELLVQRIMRSQYMYLGNSFPLEGFSDLEKYQKMSKFEKLENYPDELMRQQFDQISAFKITKLQMKHMMVNRDPIA